MRWLGNGSKQVQALTGHFGKRKIDQAGLD